LKTYLEGYCSTFICNPLRISSWLFYNMKTISKSVVSRTLTYIIYFPWYWTALANDDFRNLLVFWLRSGPSIVIRFESLCGRKNLFFWMGVTLIWMLISYLLLSPSDNLFRLLLLIMLLWGMDSSRMRSFIWLRCDSRWRLCLLLNKLTCVELISHIRIVELESVLIGRFLRRAIIGLLFELNVVHWNIQISFLI